jgi:peroxisomal enoyl-CoA hydratase 2
VIPFLSRPSPAPVPGGPCLDPTTFVDGERHIKLLKSIPTSTSPEQFELRGKCLGIYDKGKSGSVLVMRHQLVEKATDEVYSEIVCSTFAVGQGNWGGSRGPKATVYAPPRGANPTATVIKKTSTEQALLYRYVHFPAT